MTALSIDGVYFDAKSINSSGLEIWTVPGTTRRKLARCMDRSVVMSWIGRSRRTCHAVVRLTEIVGFGQTGGRRYVSIYYVRAPK